MATTYAVIDDNGICFAIVPHDREDLDDIDERYIKLQSSDDDVLYRKYDNGMWGGERHPPEEPVYNPTAEELYRAANLLNHAEILANQRQQDKVMAAILLEQVGGEANV